LHDEVQIAAFRLKVAARRRAKQIKPPHFMPAAQVRNALFLLFDQRNHNLIIPQADIAAQSIRRPFILNKPDFARCSNYFGTLIPLASLRISPDCHPFSELAFWLLLAQFGLQELTKRNERIKKYGT